MSECWLCNDDANSFCDTCGKNYCDGHCCDCDDDVDPKWYDNPMRPR